MRQKEVHRGAGTEIGVDNPMAGRVLIVEDDPLNGLLFREVLEADGFTVELVTDERQTLSTARAFAPDLIVMDIHLPHISGLSLIRMLKKDAALASVPILAVTGYVGRGEESRVRQAGACDYLPKPVSTQAFRTAVANMVPRGDAGATAADAGGH